MTRKLYIFLLLTITYFTAFSQVTFDRSSIDTSFTFDDEALLNIYLTITIQEQTVYWSLEKALQYFNSEWQSWVCDSKIVMHSTKTNVLPVLVMFCSRCYYTLDNTFFSSFCSGFSYSGIQNI
ncbi:MAG: hypothetical protein R2771_09545 [Saprospiraceae bacterium]